MPDDLLDDLLDLPASIVFDFDGTMVDTETAEYEAVRLVYAELGFDLAPDRWMAAAGTTWGLNWIDDLVALAEGGVDADEVRRRKYARSAVIDLATTLRPGLLSFLDEARARAIPLAVASNSPSGWVEPQLERLGISEHFEAIVTIEHVARGKPDPDPYLEAVGRLGAAPSRSVAFEDSHAGTKSAAAAGLFVIAVPGPMTTAHDLSGAHLHLDGFDGLTLASVSTALGQARP